ncbi:PAQR family membrane homeostasis protein TrhA [Rhodocyclus tenuis]|uniref:Hemolysin III n=1 Tax=Rhodocyclus tenuis TaxID=1066 RepID=A0A840GEY5_RHOTE|nr:hemolysin III family protein [Rhodocyclus tenuis]MBB4247112.1 hemolysin III [Rhodocyclus tenuis]
MYYGERFNAISHLAGALLALTGGIFLLLRAAHGGDALAITSVAVYGATLVLLYSVSTLYHSFRGRAKAILQKLDHQSIYLLIAGSYTPFCLVTLRGESGWWLFGVVWSLALIGMLQEIRPRSQARVLSLLIYVVMGWAALFAIEPLLEGLGTAGFAWLAAGGLSYTIGIIFYAFDSRFRHWHGIWHLFVLGGSAMHYAVVFFYVL